MPVKRLFPVNETLTAKHAIALKVIAADLGCPADAIYIGSGASAPAVFYEAPRAAKAPAAPACLEALYWQECQAKAAVAALLARLGLDPDQERPA
jgi:hypothetical protein